MENEPVIHGGEIREDTYKDFQDEVILFNEVFAEVLTEGDADGLYLHSRYPHTA